ncbi:hypothetical protein ZWY2020_047832 [Hordeum vulgare]|nr:hypothetical protein ZWY2020_047832 [Hordeum vulgare]
MRRSPRSSVSARTTSRRSASAESADTPRDRVPAQVVCRLHGEYAEVLEKDFFSVGKAIELLLCHFYHRNSLCKHTPNLAGSTSITSQTSRWLFFGSVQKGITRTSQAEDQIQPLVVNKKLAHSRFRPAQGDHQDRLDLGSLINNSSSLFLHTPGDTLAVAILIILRKNIQLGHHPNSEALMAEIVILLAIEKIGIALTNGAANQASALFVKYGTQLLELQRSMDRVVRELRVMHDFLCQMDIRNRNKQAYESWLEEVRKVAHLMEDMVDEYLYLVGQEQDIGCCFYMNNGFRKPRSLLSLNKISFNVKEIEKDLSHLSETKNRWVPVNDGDTSNSNYIVKMSQDLANISRSLDEDLVGVDKKREILEQWLAVDDLQCSVIALHGMGGLGKTALAANVYKNEREKFACHAWVSISQTYSEEDVFQKIAKELSRDKISVLSNTSDMDIRCLEEKLKEFLEQKNALQLKGSGGIVSEIELLLWSPVGRKEGRKMLHL